MIVAFLLFISGPSFFCKEVYTDSGIQFLLDTDDMEFVPVVYETFDSCNLVAHPVVNRDHGSKRFNQ
jgi:hypothetical protein